MYDKEKNNTRSKHKHNHKPKVEGVVIMSSSSQAGPGGRGGSASSRSTTGTPPTLSFRLSSDLNSSRGNKRVREVVPFDRGFLLSLGNGEQLLRSTPNGIGLESIQCYALIFRNLLVYMYHFDFHRTFLFAARSTSSCSL